MNNQLAKKEPLFKDRNLLRLLIILVAVFAVCSATKSDLFLKSDNFISMGRQLPELGILAVAMSLALLLGGIDLSIVSVANLCSFSCATFILSNVQEGSTSAEITGLILIGILIALAVSIGVGALNGTLISKVGIPPILATLGTQQLWMGVVIVATGGSSVSGLPEEYAAVFNNTLGGVLPSGLIFFIVCAIIIGIMLTKTKFGQSLYMLGTNPKAAKYAGLKNDKLIIQTFILTAVLSMVAGLLMMGRSNATKADYGTSYMMQAIMVAVLGGISSSGGRGNIIGVVIAIVIMQMISSWLAMFTMLPSTFRDVIWGGVLIGAMILNYYAAIRESKRR